MLSHYGKGGNKRHHFQAPFHNEEAAIKELENVDYDILKPISFDDARQGKRYTMIFIPKKVELCISIF